jgi:predicted aconitase
MTLRLTDVDRAMLSGEAGPATGWAMEILVAFAEAVGAEALIDISQAHVDGCLYHGQASLDFVERLAGQGGRVCVPTTLNVGSIDLIHPELMAMGEAAQAPGRRLMRAHEALGCRASFTCAPYQSLSRPRFGEQIAWGESNAIVFANSVIGARTNRYGDFIDLTCAMTGRAPAWGLHLDENRCGEILFRLAGFPASLAAGDALYVGVGLVVGAKAGERVAAIEGLPRPRDEDQLKAFGAAAASSGATALFHAVGITPEALSLSDALHGGAPARVETITPADVKDALQRLSAVADGAPIVAVCLGTPHFSTGEWARLFDLLEAIEPRRGVPIYVSTGRETLQGLDPDRLRRAEERCGLVAVVDTCTYVTAILGDLSGAVMTNSGKWAYYAPANIGATVAFGELADCVASAAAGKVVRTAP